MNVICPCGTQFHAAAWKITSGKGKFCSKRCFYRFRSPRPSGLKYRIKVRNRSWIKNGQRLSPSTEFQHGRIPHNFKGDQVGYDALHDWVKRHLGKATCCDHCGGFTNVQWANRTWKYLRDTSDWIELCYRCHRKYDMNGAWGSVKKHFVMDDNLRPRMRL